MLRLGLISDIHADHGALVMALDLLQEKGVDKVVCLGDLVEKGDDGDQVVATIEAHWIPCVQGNHDENAVIHSTWPVEMLPEGYEEIPLQPETLAFLDALPQQRSYEWEGQRILMVHATPSSLRASLFHEHEPGLFAKRFKKEVVGAGVHAILLGHTHAPMEASYKGVKIFNPGAVCRRRPRDSHTCAILTLPTYQFEVFDICTRKPLASILRIHHV